MEDIYTYFYNAAGEDREISLQEIDLSKLQENNLLFINILKRDETVIGKVVERLKCDSIPVRSILERNTRPKFNRYDLFYHFSITSVSIDETGWLIPIPIDFLVGKNFVITVHDGEVPYFREFREQDKAETQIGELDAESFVAALLDMHIVTYFRALETIEEKVDRMDVLVLRKDLEDEEFLRETVRLKNSVARLRRWFLPHREVFYALSRPDFQPVSQLEPVADYQFLTQHFENAVDAIEASRDTVLSLFDLYTTRAAHKMNNFIKRLTFITIIIGTLGAVAGLLGMNFELEIFKTAERGFWMTIVGMSAFVLISVALGKFFRWF
jgi:Mg2+ and Co2+ transporters